MAPRNMFVIGMDEANLATLLNLTHRNEAGSPEPLGPGMTRFEEIGLDVGRHATERCTAVADDFTSVRSESAWTMTFRRRTWEARTVTRTVLTSDETDFPLHATLDGYGESVASSPVHGMKPCRGTASDSSFESGTSRSNGKER